MRGFSIFCIVVDIFVVRVVFQGQLDTSDGYSFYLAESHKYTLRFLSVVH